MQVGKENTAVFIGHNECNLEDDKVKEAIRHIITMGVNEFLSGGHGGFDRLVARCAYELKEEYPYIKKQYCYTLS